MYIYKLTGRDSSIKALVQKLEKWDSKEINVIKAMAYGYLYLKNYEKSAEYFQQVLAFDPGNPSNYHNIACLYALQNKQKEALEWVEADLLDPKDEMPAW